MTNKRRLTLVALAAFATGLIASSILGALHVPSGVNIAAALTITLAMLVEAPLAAMAIAKYKGH
jgi:multisubunit Na+/H+ antiporter MnhG subunit